MRAQLWGTTRAQPTGRFRRFTDRARRAICLAQEEARLLRHDHVGTEHLLLGLLDEGEGVAAKALDSLGVSRESVRAQVEEIIGHGTSPPAGQVPFTPPAKKVLELSLREALALGHHYIGTEHLLLALLREGDGVAAQVLVRLGADHARVLERVLGLLTGRQGRPGKEISPVEENQRLHREVDRLRDLLRQHGIEPDGGTARTA